MRWWQGIRLDQGTNRTGTQSFSLFPEVSAVCWLGTTPPFAWNIQRFRVPFRPELSNPRLQSLSTGHAIWWKTVSNFSTFPAVPNVQISFSEDTNAIGWHGVWVVRRGSQTTTEFGRFDFVSVSLTLSHPPGIILLLMSMWHKLRKLARADKSVTWLNQESAALSRHETIAIRTIQLSTSTTNDCLSVCQGVGNAKTNNGTEEFRRGRVVLAVRPTN